jgi:hypothetical protein
VVGLQRILSGHLKVALGVGAGEVARSIVNIYKTEITANLDGESCLVLNSPNI